MAGNDVNKKLEKQYRKLGSPFALSTIQRLQSLKKFKKNDIQNYLQSKDSFTLHAKTWKKYPRNYFKIEHLGDLAQADLADMSRYKSVNNNYKYLLFLIEVFSKQLAVIPLKTKTAEEVTKAMSVALKNFKFPIKTLETDGGLEFRNRNLQDLLAKNNIRYRRVTNPVDKAIIVERSIRTIRLLISRYMTEYNTNSYITALPNIVKTYNSRVHSTIKRAPQSVTVKNQGEVLKIYKQKWAKLKRKNPKFKLGDIVRIQKAKSIFDKESDNSFTKELFKIAHVNISLPLPMYVLRDLKGELITGHFQEEELQKVNIDMTRDLFIIEKILKYRGKGKKREAFVKWQSYGPVFNSWVKAADVQRL